MTRSALENFLQLKSISPSFINAWGEETQISDEKLKLLINKMGFDSEDEQALQDYYNEQEQEHWLSFLAEVSVFKQNSCYKFDAYLPINLSANELLLTVVTEDGEVIKKTLKANDSPLNAVKIISEIEHHCYTLNFDDDLPLGYHTLSLCEVDSEKILATMSLIIAPDKCYSPSELYDGKKIWGTSVQLYGIKSETNWGIGDFTDLKYLIRKINEKGGDFVGLNPIHALPCALPENPSPYSPSSRKWLNILYIDINSVAELRNNQSLQNQRSYFLSIL